MKKGAKAIIKAANAASPIVSKDDVDVQDEAKQKQLYKEVSSIRSPSARQYLQPLFGLFTELSEVASHNGFRHISK